MKATGDVIGNAHGDCGFLTLTELKEILYNESIHICQDEIEASVLAMSALSDFIKSYPYYCEHQNK